MDELIGDDPVILSYLILSYPVRGYYSLFLFFFCRRFPLARGRLLCKTLLSGFCRHLFGYRRGHKHNGYALILFYPDPLGRFYVLDMYGMPYAKKRDINLYGGRHAGRKALNLQPPCHLLNDSAVRNPLRPADDNNRHVGCNLTVHKNIDKVYVLERVFYRVSLKRFKHNGLLPVPLDRNIQEC